MDVLPNLIGIDAVITDPPYGLKENAHRIKSRTKLAKTTDYGDFEWDKEPASKEEVDAIRRTAEKVIIWGGNYFHLPPSRGWLVWDKLNSGNFADGELAWTNLETSVRIFRFMWNGMIRDGESRGRPRVHPTQKPVELLNWCLRFVNDSQTICDPMMGSGTTGIACIRTGRKFIGIEIDKGYFDISCDRIRRELAQLNLPLNISENSSCKQHELVKI